MVTFHRGTTDAGPSLLWAMPPSDPNPSDDVSKCYGGLPILKLPFAELEVGLVLGHSCHWLTSHISSGMWPDADLGRYDVSQPLSNSSSISSTACILGPSASPSSPS